MKRIQSVDRRARRDHDVSALAACAGCPSCGGHRTVGSSCKQNECNFTRRARNSRGRTLGFNARIRRSVQSCRERSSRWPCGVPQRRVAGSAKASASPMPCGVCALGCQEYQALAASNEMQEEQSPIRLWSGAQCTSSWRVRALSVRWPNPSVEGTHNGGARLFAPSKSTAPLCAPHVKR